MKTLLLAIAGCTLFVAQANTPHDAGYWAQLVSNLATVITVMYAMGRWGKKQRDEYARRREEHEQEMVAKQKIYQQIVKVVPSIIERMEKMEDEIKEIRQIVHPQLKTPPVHEGDSLVQGVKD